MKILFLWLSTSITCTLALRNYALNDYVKYITDASVHYLRHYLRPHQYYFPHEGKIISHNEWHFFTDITFTSTWITKPYNTNRVLSYTHPSPSLPADCVLTWWPWRLVGAGHSGAQTPRGAAWPPWMWGQLQWCCWSPRSNQNGWTTIQSSPEKIMLNSEDGKDRKAGQVRSGQVRSIETQFISMRK